jgi:predicted PurR-regulated permease PerM
MIHRSRTSLLWFLVISAVILLIAAVLGLGGGLINFIDQHSNILDTQYIPKDLDRQSVDALKDQLKDIDQGKMEQLKKKLLEKQSKP